MSERMFAGLTPTNDDVHENTPVSLATAWLAAVDGTIDGQVFRASTDPTGTYTAKTYQMLTSDTEAGAGGTGLLLPGSTKAYTGVVADTDIFVLYDTPIPVLAGNVFKSVLETSTGHYSATNNYFASADHVEGNLTAPKDNSAAGGFTVFNGTFIGGTAYPVNHFLSTLYHISPLFTAASAEPNEGSAAVIIDLAPAATGARVSAGLAAVRLGLAIDADGARNSQGLVQLGLGLQLDTDGGRPGTGRADLGLGLALDTDGGRSAGGSTSLGLGLALDIDGGRPAGGAAALGLILAPDARGSAPGSGNGSAAFHLNLALAAIGDASRCANVPSFPWCTSAPPFPGTCGQVPSFSEVQR